MSALRSAIFTPVPDPASRNSVWALRFSDLLKDRPDLRGLLGFLAAGSAAGRDDFVGGIVDELVPDDPDRVALKRRLVGAMNSLLPSNSNVIREVGLQSFGDADEIFMGSFHAEGAMIEDHQVPADGPQSGIGTVRRLIRKGFLHADPNLPEMRGVYFVDGQPNLVMEAVNREPVGNFMNVHGDMLLPSERARVALHVFAGTARALEAMAQHQLVHHDVKPDHIVLDMKTLQAKLFDHGSVGPGQSGPATGTELFCSPEHYSRDAVMTPQADVYSLALTLVALLGGTIERSANHGMRGEFPQDGSNAMASLIPLTNPTHLAIAIQYDKDETPLPVVVAKGEGWLAERMVAAAREAGVPILQNIPLAHSLMDSAVVDQYIPSELIEPVAEVLRLVRQLSDARSSI